MNKKILNYLKGLLQVNENEKASTLIAGLIISLGFGMYSYATSNPHVLDSGIKELILGLATIVAGLNIGNTFINSKNSSTSNDNSTETK